MKHEKCDTDMNFYEAKNGTKTYACKKCREYVQYPDSGSKLASARLASIVGNKNVGMFDYILQMD